MGKKKEILENNKRNSEENYKNLQTKEEKQIQKEIDSIIQRHGLDGFLKVLADKYVAQQPNQKSVINKETRFLEIEPKLSRLEINLERGKNSLEIKLILSDYNDLEIKLQAIKKTLYLLFLKYEEGMKSDDLRKHQNELYDIQSKVKNSGDEYKNKDYVDRLIDITNKRRFHDKRWKIEQEISETLQAFFLDINKTFVKEFVPTLASYYFISKQEDETFKILLSREMVDCYAGITK